MEYGKWLIDTAAQMCGGTRYGLAKAMGINESNLAGVYNGKRPFPTEWAAPMAVLAGVDPGQAVLRVLAERAKAKKPMLRKVAGLAGMGLWLGSYASTAARVAFDTMRTLSKKKNIRLSGRGKGLG